LFSTETQRRSTLINQENPAPKLRQSPLVFSTGALRFFFSPEIACNSGEKTTSGARRRSSQPPVTAVLKRVKSYLHRIPRLRHTEVQSLFVIFENNQFCRWSIFFAPATKSPKYASEPPPFVPPKLA
ncbi:hypothetical protein U1Q18_036806, partial [Sarracenia purpurea var. burkii]